MFEWACSLMVERKTDNLEAIGSSPILPIKKVKKK